MYHYDTLYRVYQNVHLHHKGGAIMDEDFDTMETEDHEYEAEQHEFESLCREMGDFD